MPRYPKEKARPPLPGWVVLIPATVTYWFLMFLGAMVYTEHQTDTVAYILGHHEDPGTRLYEQVGRFGAPAALILAMLTVVIMTGMWRRGRHFSYFLLLLLEVGVALFAIGGVVLG